MKELEDHTWFPSILRNFQTEFIGFVASGFPVYTPFVQHLNALALPPQDMNDLCSGSGEPAFSIFKKSNCFECLTLSDKYPGRIQLGKTTSIKIQNRNVLHMDFKPGNCYTMFNAFHHFRDEEKLEIAEKIKASGSTGFLVEILEPRVICFLKVLFISTIGNLLLTPFIKPFSFKRLFFTYILPVNLLTITFDGIVSVFKSRSVEHYQKLFAKFGDAVKIYRLKNGWSPLLVIQIQPEK